MARSRWLFLSLAFMCTLSVAAQPAGTPQTLRFTILSNREKAGAEVDAFSPGGHVDSTYEFNDRGRGPKIETHWLLDSSGLPLHVDVTGNDYLKSPVDEHFLIDHGQAEWKSTSEHGHAGAGGFYIGVNTPSIETALLVRALSHSGSAGVPLYPAGAAHLDKLADTTVQANGQSLHVTEYGITGLAFEPVTVWLDDRLDFFAQPGTWFAELREGWESTNDALYKLQAQAETDRLHRIAQDLTRHPQHPIAIEHVRLFDSIHAVMVEDQTVVVDGNHIAAVGPALSTQVPPDAERIDGHGKTLLPGLFDMHVHLAPLDGILDIASGITSVRDMGNSISDLALLDEQWKTGTAIGPRVSKAGLIDGPGPYQAPTGILAGTQKDADAAVNRYADLGYVQTKIYSSFDPALLPEVIYLSHARGMRVSGHIPNGITATQFVEAGADEIQHINFIMLNFFPEKVKDTRTPERFTAVGQYAAGLDLDSKPVNDFIALLQLHHTTLDPTLVAFEPMYIARPGQVDPSMKPILDRLPAQVQRGAYVGGLPVTPANDQTYRDSWAVMLKMTKRLYDAGVPILAGTDSLAGLMLHHELELQEQAGIPPLAALQNATLLAATVLREQLELGSIQTGKLADLVLVDGNPGVNISDIRRCRTVFKNGDLYDSGKLYAAVGIGPAL
jgi:imidazolonepropionase-like amidohydrolase